MPPKCDSRWAIRARRDEAGFTLVEVIVALALLAVLASASLAFFVRGTRAVTSQQRTQSAIAVANDAMEETFSHIAAISTAGTSGLVVGRTQVEVLAAWATAVAASTAGLAESFPAWDTAATAPVPIAGITDDVIPLSASVTESRMRFTVTNLIGVCYRAQASVSASCTQSGGSALGVPSTGYVRMMRSVVVVTWPNVAKSCAGTLCRYSIASLIDPSADLEWNNTTRLLAADDSVSVNAGSSVAIDVLANDTLMQLSANPIEFVSPAINKLTTAAMGTAVLNTADGKVTYTADATAHGEVTFVYRIKVLTRTAQAMVHVYVTPLAPSYTATVEIDHSVSIPVVTRSGAAPSAIQVSGVGASVSGGSLVYSAPHGAGSYSFSYTYTDLEGTSLPGTVQLLVTAYAPPVAAAAPKTIPAMSAPTAIALNLLTVNSYSSPYKIKVTGLPTPSGTVLKFDSSAVAAAVGNSGTNLSFTPATNVAGTYTFTYSIVTPDGVESSPATATIQVVQPVGTDRAFTVPKNSTDNLLDLVASELSIITPVTVETSGLASNCGSLAPPAAASTTSASVIYTPKNGSSSCTFSYVLRPATAGLMSSSAKTVTVSVSK